MMPSVHSDDQPTVLAQALAAASMVADYCTEMLNGMVPYLPPDLVIEALAASPTTSAEALTAVLKKGNFVLPPEGVPAFVGLLRDGLNGTDRDACLGLIKAVAPTIAEIGGVGAIQQIISAVADVYRWWP